MAFPTDLATFTTVTTGSKQNSPSHLGLHNDLADTVEALEAKVGVDSSAVATSHDYLIRHLPIQAANVTMGGYKISNLGAAVAANDAVRMNQSVLLDGSQTMTGNLNMGTHSILGVVDPSNAQDAATKNYVDTDGIYHNVGARAYLSSSQLNIVTSTYTKVLLGSETYDLNDDFADYKFVAPVAGYYVVNAQNGWGGLTVNKFYRTVIYKNGAKIATGCNVPSLATTITVPVFTICHLDATDYIELYAYHNAGVNTPDIYGDANGDWTYMEVFLLKRD